MSFKIKYQNPSVTSTTTTLGAASEIGDTTITVADSSSFSANDFVLIEVVGCNLLELRQISSVPSSTSITLSAALTYNHAIDITVTKLSYNKMRLYYGTTADTATFVLKDTQDIDYTTYNNKTELTSLVGDYKSWWKVGYYNSQTDTESLSASFQSNEYESLMTVKDLRDLYEFDSDISDAKLYSALEFASEQTLKRMFTRRNESTNQRDTIFHILRTNILEIGKRTLGTVIDSDDVIVYEVDTDNKRTYLNTKIIMVDEIGKLIRFSSTVPSESSTLMVEFYAGYWRPEEQNDSIKQILGLYASHFILSKTIITEAQEGVTNWSLNGVSISVDSGNIKSILDDIMNQIAQVVTGTSRIYMGGSRMTNGRRIDRHGSASGFRGTTQWRS